MEKIENRCCDCAAPGYPCIGNACSLRHCRVLYCDKCNEEVDKLYVIFGQELCEECALEELETDDEGLLEELEVIE